MRDLFRLDEPGGERWELALDLLGQGTAIVISDVGISLDERSLLRVFVNSSWQLENLTKQSAEEDLARARRVVARLLAADPRFADLAADRRHVYELQQDYGNGSVLLCTLRDGELHWAPGVQKASN
jgi:hypothetical protein